jgi:hypothetical protein
MPDASGAPAPTPSGASRWEGEEVAQMDAYIASRFETPKARREQGGVPAPVMIVS